MIKGEEEVNSGAVPGVMNLLLLINILLDSGNADVWG